MNPQEKRDQEIQHNRDAMAAGRDLHFFSADAESIAGRSRSILRPPIARLSGRVRGRERLIERLSMLVDRPDGRAHALVGLGGTGKSTVALVIADQAIMSGHDVWWVTATDAATVNSSLLALASHLGARPEQVESALLGEISSFGLLWDRLEARPGWVLVLDRADDLQALAVGDRPVSEGLGWIRGSKAGLLLLTTRNGDPRAWGRSVELHQVGWLNDQDGARVLTDLASGGGSSDDAERLSARLGGLPLALHMAGAYLAQNRTTFKDYERQLQESTATKHGDRQLVGRTSELCLGALDRYGEVRARQLMEGLCWLAGGTPIPARRMDPKVLLALRHIALIDVQAEAADRIGDWIVVHPLVSESFRNLLVDSGRARETASAAVDLLRAQTADLTQGEEQDWYAWLPHLKSLLALAAGRLESPQLAELAGIAARLTQALSWVGDHVRAEALAGSALQETSRLGLDNGAVIELSRAMATALQVRGDYAHAEALLRNIIETLQRILGPDHPDTQSARFELARVIVAQGRLEEAEFLLQEVLEEQLQILGPEHNRVLLTRSELAYTLILRGHYDESYSLLKEVYATQIGAFGADHPDTINTMLRIGQVCALAGQWTEAELLIRESRERIVRVLGPEHPMAVHATLMLAAVLTDKGGRSEARALLRDLLAVQRRILDPDDPAIARTSDMLRRLGTADSDSPAPRE